jgi:hypothetical protein
MVVRIRFGRGPVVTRRAGKNSRIAKLTASLLTLVFISFAALGLWRIGTDLNLAGEFVFPGGLLSHWQVWIGAAIATQYTSWRLGRYARTAQPRDEDEDADKKSPANARAAANG